jgi:hypothetical protein
MRVKSHWFKEGRQHSAREVSDALAFTLWRLADHALQNTRKFEFEIKVGIQYLDFLAEFLVFLILCADRIAYRRLSAENRQVFTENLANRAGAVYAENRSRLLVEDEARCKRDFIELLNVRAGEYADFSYGDTGPEYGFYRYLAWCIGKVLSEQDAVWVTDPIVSYEAPEAVKVIEKALDDLWEEKPRKPRRQNALSGE